MDFTSSIKKYYQNWNNFSGRSSLSEYYYPSLFQVLLYSTLATISFLLNLTAMSGSNDLFEDLGNFIAFIHFVPNLAVTVRRLHDVGRSGWWLFLWFSLIGIIPLIYWIFFKASDFGENKFGYSSKSDDPMNLELPLDLIEANRCSNCGGSHLTKNGIETKTHIPYQRYRCSECGAALRGRLSGEAKLGSQYIKEL